MRQFNPGQLRHTIQIQASSESQDPMIGENIPTWNTIATRRAFVRPKSGKEVLQATQQHAEVTHLVTMRYLKNITSKNRLIYNGRDFEIVFVIDVEERKRWLELLCIERP